MYRLQLANGEEMLVSEIRRMATNRAADNYAVWYPCPSVGGGENHVLVSKECWYALAEELAEGKNDA